MIDPTDDMAGILTLPDRTDTAMGFHQGEVISFDLSTGENIIRVKGVELVDLPVMNVTDSAGLLPGMIVGILRVRSVYFVIGRIATPGSANFGHIEVRSNAKEVIRLRQGTINFYRDGSPADRGYLAILNESDFGLVLSPPTYDLVKGSQVLFTGCDVDGNSGVISGYAHGHITWRSVEQIILDAPFVSVTAPNTAAAANVNLSASGNALRISTSARKYKQDIEDFTVDPAEVLKLRPRTWRDKEQVRENPNTTLRHAGFVAEEVAEIPGLEPLVLLDKEGEPNALSYDRFSAALISVMQAQQKQIDDLTQRLEALEH